MGVIHTKITLHNPREPSLSPMDTDALVDTGSLHLCIPQHVAIQLKVNEIYRREVTLADGRKQLVPYVGPIQISFGNRGCFTGALVLGDEVILGSVPMEDMDLVISPAQRSVVPNPVNPNIPASIVKAYH
jgi:clan AA aspartic protease